MQWIERNIHPKEVLTFDNVTVEDVLRRIKDLKSKKSMGCNQLPPKVIISGATTLCTDIAMQIKICICFPIRAKIGRNYTSA